MISGWGRIAAFLLLWVGVVLLVVGFADLWFRCLDPDLLDVTQERCLGIVLRFGIPVAVCFAGAFYFRGKGQ